MKNWTHFMLKPILHLFWKTKLGFPGSLTTVWFMVRFSSTGMSLIDRMYDIKGGCGLSGGSCKRGKS